MAKFCGDFANFGEVVGSEGSELVAVFGMRGKGEHLAAETHEFDAVAIIPTKHFGNIPDVG